MELVIGPRCSGKTTVLEERVRRSIRPIVVVPSLSSHADRWKHLGVVTNDIVSGHSLDRLRGVRDREIYVDDLDLIIASLIREPITTATLTISGPITHLPGFRNLNA